MSGQDTLKLTSFPDPGNRYQLEEVVRVGSFGKTYVAKDTEASNKLVVVKIQKIASLNEKYLKDEYRLLRDVSLHANIIDFYGIYCVKNEILLVTEYCEGGTVLKLVNDLLLKNRRMREEHIAHILKEVIKAVSYLHEKHIIHRDIRASNILLTKNGEVKITGFGLCVTLVNTFEKTGSAIGSPDWMAPEVIQAKNEDDLCYDNRADVWSLGMTAIELGDGKTPFKDMHPTRILFHVVRNPPPTLYLTSLWSENYNDFIAECLEKNPDHRPCSTELMGHPFIEEVPENNYHLSTELISLLDSDNIQATQEDVHVVNSILWEGENIHEEPMYVEDLAALDVINERTVLSQIENRFNDNKFQTFVGEILITLNPNIEEGIYNEECHSKYIMKSKSENAPHIYAIADSAYQNALHHVIPQKIILSGESGSGKTTNYLNIVDHLLYIGHNINVQLSRVKNAIELIHAFTHASTPYNEFSTRCILKTNISFGRTGKVTSASFVVNLLEKIRVSSTEMSQANFNIFYFIYDGIISENLAENYNLNTERKYRYLRILEEEEADTPRVKINKNITKFKKIKDILCEFDFSDEETETIFKCLSAILILGEVMFQEDKNGCAQIVNVNTVKMVAQLSDIEEKKLCWALTNYCLLKDGAVVSRKNTCDEARDTRDVLANNLYSRLVDFVVAQLNHKLALGKAIFGEKYLVQILDYPGFECFKRNELWQLFINVFNEQMQHYYLQKIFKWEIIDLREDKLEYQPISYYNNQKLLDSLLGRSGGILGIIDQASKLEYSGKYIIDYVSHMDNGHISTSRRMEFAISHYTGKVNYNAKEIPDKNRDFLPPEIIETIRSSSNHIVKLLFSEKLSRTGNLVMEFGEEKPVKASKYTSVFKQDSNSNRFSQSKKLRTLATVFKAVCLETLTDLSTNSGGTHFVRCIKTNLKSTPNNFCKELVRQQIRAMGITQTAKIRKEGYAYRIHFAEFLRRYQFLAFDFDETVDITPDNCRLLLIRLKMEGWIIGKKRVLLKYYNEEYLARLYELQVKKIIKIQSILRGFLAKCRVKKNSTRTVGGIKEKISEEGCQSKTMAEVVEHIQEGEQLEENNHIEITPDEAAQVIQKAFRIHLARNQSYSKLSKEELIFIKPWAMKWKRSSFLHLLLKLKSKKIFDTFNLSIQAFIYNQHAFYDLRSTSNTVDLSEIDTDATKPPWDGKPNPLIMKINYKWNDLPFYDTSDMLPDKTSLRLVDEHIESWDKPYQWRNELLPSSQIDEKSEAVNEKLVELPFTRNPEDILEELEEELSEMPDKISSPELERPSSPEPQSKLSPEPEMKSSPEPEKKSSPSPEKKSSPEPEKISSPEPEKKSSPEPEKKSSPEPAYKSPPKEPVEKINKLKNIKNKEYDSPKTEIIPIKLKHVEPKMNYNSDNTQPANKDFDYIKAPVLNKVKGPDPIAELKSKGRRDSASDDSPPFNFQGMLRKTDFRRESIKNIVNARRFSLNTQEKIDDDNLTNGNVPNNQNEYISFELGPDLLLEGTVYDL